MAKKRVAETSFTKGFFKCPHCDLVYDFPNDYCVACGQHQHTLFMGGDQKLYIGGGVTLEKPKNICSHCFRGRWEKGRAWRRDNGTWAPDPQVNGSWDFPEWHDMMGEHRSSMIDFVWNEDGISLEEL